MQRRRAPKHPRPRGLWEEWKREVYPGITGRPRTPEERAAFEARLWRMRKWLWIPLVLVFVLPFAALMLFIVYDVIRTWR